MPFARGKEISGTLRFRAAVWITISVIVLLIASMLAVRAIVTRFIFDSLNREMQLEFGRMRDLIIEYRGESIVRVITEIQKKVDALQNEVAFAELYDKSRTLIWRSGNFPTLKPATFSHHAPTISTEKMFQILEGSVHAEGMDLVHVRFGVSLDDIVGSLAFVDQVQFLVLLGTLLIVPLAGYLLAARALEPISTAISTANRLQPTKLNERLPVRGTGDEIDRLSATVNGLLDRMASYISRNRDFVANAAHELRSPLTAIRTSVEVALNRPRSSEEYAAILADVMEETSRLSNLVSRLMILAETESGQVAMTEHRSSFDKIVQQSVDMFGGVAEAKGLTLTSQIEPNLPVFGEEHYHRQVVRNLVDNAIKFTPSGGRIRVTVQKSADEKWVEMTVADSGVGIAAEDLPHVFDRFFRGDRSRRRETQQSSTGLGLSICQTIVTELQGTIRVESQLSAGSRFCVRIPLAENVPPRT